MMDYFIFPFAQEEEEKNQSIYIFDMTKKNEGECEEF